MKIIYKSSQTGEFYMIKTLLESHGIDITVKNEYLHSLGARVGFPGSSLELWVNKKTDYKLAEEILQKHQKPKTSKKTDSWKCKKCGEIIEGEFAACWKCGNNKVLF